MILYETVPQRVSVFFFFNDTATTEIYTLSLHDALPIFRGSSVAAAAPAGRAARGAGGGGGRARLAGRRPAAAAAERVRVLRPDRKSTRLNSSHANISYAVFCLKKNKEQIRYFVH